MKKLIFIFFLVITRLVTNAQWTITSGPSEPNVTSLAANDSIVIAGCSSASSNLGGHRTLNQGNNWSPTGGNLLSKFTSLAINSVNGVIYAGGGNTFYQSSDNGSTFTNTNNGLSPYTTYDIIIDGSNLYASTQGVYFSNNSGLNWSLISPVIASYKMDKSNDTIIVATINSGIYLSTDNGVSWINIVLGLPSNIADVKIVGNNYLAATVSGILISTNNGASWTTTNLTLNTQCIYQVGTTLFAGCSGGGVYYSTNGGTTWIAENTGLTNLTVYSLSSNSTYLFAGTTGYVFRRPLIDFGIISSISNQNDNEKEIRIIPNPSFGNFIINQAKAKKLEIEIHNSFGNVIYKTVSEDSNIKIDLGNTSKGIYFIRIIDSSKDIIERKIILN